MIKTLAKNKYKIIVELARTDGKRHRTTKTVYCTKAEARLIEAEMIKDSQHGIIKPNKKLTLNELADIFIEDYCKPRLKENTIHGYKELLKVISKEIGILYIEKITPYDLQRFYNKLASDYNHSSNTICHYYTLLNNIFKRATIWQFIKENPNSKLDKPKIEKKEVITYDYEEVDKLLKALKAEPITNQALIILCLDSGMRREKINGLKWQDINFSEREIEIKRVRLAVGNKIIEETPKTVKSNRTIIVTELTIELLKKLKVSQEINKELLQEKWQETGYVFVNQEGKPFYPCTPSKILNRVLKKYDLKMISFHKLRHTSATLLINSNADVASVSARLGHANNSTTLNIYSHSLDKSKKEMADKMSAILKSA